MTTTHHETMTTTSDSRFFHSDCCCIKREVQNNIFIECRACIEGHGKWNNGRGCSCEYHKVNQMHCPICAADRDRLDELHFEFDNLLLKLSSTVKSYDSCNDDIQAIEYISKRMRQCNRNLLARLISHEFDDEDAVMPDPLIEDPDTDTESRERGIERRENGERPRSAWKPSDDEEEVPKKKDAATPSIAEPEFELQRPETEAELVQELEDLRREMDAFKSESNRKMDKQEEEEAKMEEGYAGCDGNCNGVCNECNMGDYGPCSSDDEEEEAREGAIQEHTDNMAD